jgi:hypothetical protein
LQESSRQLQQQPKQCPLSALTLLLYKMDSIVTAVIEKFKQRSEFGKAKYGTDLDRKDLSILEWIVHAQEEHMDAILYLEKLKVELRVQNVLNVTATSSGR